MFSYMAFYKLPVLTQQMKLRLDDKVAIHIDMFHCIKGAKLVTDVYKSLIVCR